jgi:exopolyphosphatase/guanosine-5'-triphosphate,3'-diphosphate pyrophosphatase
MGTATPPKKHGSLGVPVPRSKVIKAAKKLARLKPAQRTAIPGIGPNRAEIIVAGAFTFAELLSEFRLPGFRYSNLGLRDGLLAQMASDFDRSLRPRRQIVSERWDAVLDSIKAYRADAKYSSRVRTLALDLFKKLAPVHELPAAYAEWISVAAMLHEVGMYINRYGWHRHAYYIIANSEMFGYTTYEQRLIAAIARYLGNSRPSANDKPVRALLPADRLLVPKASLLLRIARALNQSRRGVVRGVSVQIKGSQVRMRLRTAPRARADLEQWAIAKEAAYFRELFGRELEIAAS